MYTTNNNNHTERADTFDLGFQIIVICVCAEQHECWRERSLAPAHFVPETAKEYQKKNQTPANMARN